MIAIAYPIPFVLLCVVGLLVMTTFVYWLDAGDGWGDWFTYLGVALGVVAGVAILAAFVLALVYTACGGLQEGACVT